MPGSITPATPPLWRRRYSRRVCTLAAVAWTSWAGAAAFAADGVDASASDGVDASASDGWAGMRVIKQEGEPQRLLTADLDGDGRQEIVVLNTRMARIDIYDWQPCDQRDAPIEADAKRPNELPLAPEWKRRELGLEELPVDLLVCDQDGDGKSEFVILTSPSNRILMYVQDAAGQWTKKQHWDLLPGSPSAREALLRRDLGSGKSELLVGCEQGVQQLSLEPGARPTWLSPREGRGRLRWRLVDLDADGDEDLVEWSPDARQAIRWYECRQGRLLPPQVLHDKSIDGMDLMALGGGRGELLLLGGVQSGLLRRYALERGEQSELGRRDALPMAAGPKAVWAGLMIDGQPAMASIDSSQPMLRVQALGEEGWLPDEAYPIVPGVQAVAPALGEPGTLLMSVKDSGDLYVSRWDGGRMSYPKLLEQSDEAADRGVVGMGRVGDVTWWAKRSADDLLLYTWPRDAAEPQRTRFAGAGVMKGATARDRAPLEKVVWLGDAGVLAKYTHQLTAKLVARKDDEDTAVVTDPPTPIKDLAEFGLYQIGDQRRVGRMTQGVLQWLDSNLQPVDQVMLPDGQRLASFVPLADGTAWALQQGGEFLHRLRPDESGILRVADSLKPPGGATLELDPALGLVLVDQDRIVRMAEGRPFELTLRESIDGKFGRAAAQKGTIHRILTTDVTGDGCDEVILCDDERHELMVLGRSDEGLTPLLTWNVFEDRTYPYGGVEGSHVSEPRAIAGFDADGDGQQDLALLCHDRLLIYLANEEGESSR